MSTGQVVAVVNRTTSTLVTYDSEGKQQADQGDSRREGRPAPDPRRGRPDLRRRRRGRARRGRRPGRRASPTCRSRARTARTAGQAAGWAAGARRRRPSRATPRLRRDSTTAADDPAAAADASSRTRRVDPRAESHRCSTTAAAARGAARARRARRPVVNATAGDASATVNWGPAPDNRSADHRLPDHLGRRSDDRRRRQRADLGDPRAGQRHELRVHGDRGQRCRRRARRGVEPGDPGRAVPAGERADQPGRRLQHRPTRRVDELGPAGGHRRRHARALHRQRHRPFRTYQSTGESRTIDDIQVGPARSRSRSGPSPPTRPGSSTSARQAATTSGRAQPGNGTVTLTQGASTQEYCEGDPDCAWMHVVLTGFPPNTRVRADAALERPRLQERRATGLDRRERQRGDRPVRVPRRG